MGSTDGAGELAAEAAVGKVIAELEPMLLLELEEWPTNIKRKITSPKNTKKNFVNVLVNL